MPLSEHVHCVAISFKMTERIEQRICIKFWIKLEHSSTGWFTRLSGMMYECNTNKSVAQTLQRWLRICWKWSMFWKACNKQNTWESWMCMSCNQRRLATDSVRTRSWSEDSKNYYVWDFDSGSWHGTCDKIRSAAFATRAEGIEHCS